VVLGALFLPALVQADYEQVPEHFGVGGEAQRLMEGEVQGMAVNATGAGGVQPGTLYAVTSGSGSARRAVLRFSPGSEGEEPQFQEAWGWAIGSEAEEFQRCGPALATEPAAHTFHTCAALGGRAYGGEGVGHFEALTAVAIDPANGYVYVRNSHVGPRKQHLIEVFTATGTPVGEGFGEVGNASSTPPESIAEGPAKLHQGDYLTESMTVNEAGTVYLTDQDYSGVAGQSERRVMSFEPEGGHDFEHYVYTGQEHDLVFAAAEMPRKIGWVDGNRLVTAREEQVHEYAIRGGSASPLCSLAVSGRLTALAANPLTGEAFYFNEVKRNITRLGACDEMTGKFIELQQFVPEPKTEIVRAMAVNPSGSWSPLRPAGILYAASELESAEGYSVFGDIFASAPVLSPVVESESVADTGSTSTTLQARIDPRGFNTSYTFEYLPASTYAAQLATAEGEGKSGAEAEGAAFIGAVRAPASPGQVESGAVRTAVASVGVLAPDTAYRFRVVATSECNGAHEPACETDGEAASFATYPTVLPGLPDGRAYELVSPAQKNGGEVFPAEPSIGSCGTVVCKPPGGFPTQVDPMQSASDGDALAYMGYAFSPTEGAAAFNSYVSRRTADGWQTTAETPFQQATHSQGTFAYSEDLREGTIQSSRSQISVQDTGDPSSLTPVVPSPRYREGEDFVEYGGYSADFSAQFFSANDSLTPATSFAPEPPDPDLGGRDLYEWRGGHLSLVNVLPGDSMVATGAAFASSSPDAHAVSADGNRVFWHVGSTVYVREDGQETREITHPGTFLTASEDGGEVLLSDGCLYSLATEACADVTQGEGGFQGIASANGALSRIYFVDTAKLPASGENERKEEAMSGKPNLYLYEAGTTTRFIATLAVSDGDGGTLNDWAAVSGGQRTAEASPNGRYLAFASTERLTGYANIGPCATITNSEHELEIVDAPCKEVFLYDSLTGRLSCPSCSPTGEAPLGNSTLRRIAGAKPFFPQPRYLTDAGRLFFDSPDRLSPLDTNGGVEDVYEAEPAGVGTCTRVAGCVLLISSGKGSVDSNFLAMDGEGEREGSDVFFTTRDRVVPSDKDDLIDVYDAREGGGFPSESEAPPAGCEGEACQSLSSPPATLPLASQLFSGAGNVKPESPRVSSSGNVKPRKPLKCPKGKVKRNGRCVKKMVRHKTRGRRSRKASHANLTADRRKHR
jgi:hypothetical protein